jgi:hypothetical protein
MRKGITIQVITAVSLLLSLSGIAHGIPSFQNAQGPASASAPSLSYGTFTSHGWSSMGIIPGEMTFPSSYTGSLPGTYCSIFGASGVRSTYGFPFGVTDIDEDGATHSPIPSLILLFGMGLTGFGFLKRKKAGRRWWITLPVHIHWTSTAVLVTSPFERRLSACYRR